VSIYAFWEYRLRIVVVWKPTKHICIALTFLAVLAFVNSNHAWGQKVLGLDFDPLGLLEETQRKRESIAAGSL
jgi:hypothetical protein